MMKAIYQDEYGLDFKLGELPKPKLGDGQVLLKVHAAGVNPVDVKRHLFMKDESFPMIAGYDVAGVIEELGSGDTKSFKVGDRVFGEVTGNAAAPKTRGAFAEYIAVPAGFLVAIPKGATFEQMAATPVAIGTAFMAMDELEVKPGQKVFISGGAGGVGVHAIQIAKTVYGAAEVATTASVPKKPFVEKHGVDVVVDYKTQDAGEVLKGWADASFDCTGEPDMIHKIKKEGGKSATIVQFGHPDVPMLMLAASSALMTKIADAVAQGKLKIELDTVYSLDDGIKAIEHVKSGRAKGKVVIKIN